MTKSQFPNKSQISNSKKFGYWVLGIVWNLVFGTWDFMPQAE